MPAASPQHAAIRRSAFGSIATAEIKPKVYQDILGKWDAQREGRRFPQIEKIDPFLLPALVPHIILYDVSGPAVTFRIVGEGVVTTVGTNLKGKTLAEAFGNTPFVLMVEEQLRECAACGVPIYSRHDFQLKTNSSGPGDPNQIHEAWRLALPYGTGDRVTRLLCYQLFSQPIEPHIERKINFGTLLPSKVFKVEL